MFEQDNEVDLEREFLSHFKKYRKKPVIVHARQMEESFEIKKLKGVMKGQPGDYLVIGTKGERYPVKKEIFEECYELYEGTEETERIKELKAFIKRGCRRHNYE